jgi:hypothetical protein
MRILLLLLVLSGHVHAAVVAHAVTNDNKVLNLHDVKCDTMGYRAELVSELITVFQGCWAPHPNINGAIHITWKDGDESIVPRSVFKAGPHGTNVSK